MATAPFFLMCYDERIPQDSFADKGFGLGVGIKEHGGRWTTGAWHGGHGGIGGHWGRLPGIGDVYPKENRASGTFTLKKIVGGAGHETFARVDNCRECADSSGLFPNLRIFKAL